MATLIAIAALCLSGTALPQTALALTSAQDRAAPPTHLVFAPETPAPGSTVIVTYHPVDDLAGEPRLVLRGHFRIAGAIVWGRPPPNRQVATLMPGDGGSFTGSFRVPEAAAYAAFVVEDLAGERLDTNGGRQFELLVHGGDAASLSDVLIERARDHEDRDPAVAAESMQRAMALLPEAMAERHPGAAIVVRSSESIDLGGAAAARLMLPPEMQWTAAWFRWEEDGDSRVALEELEEHWPAAEGRGTGIAASGLMIAVRARDAAAVERWSSRTLAEGTNQDPWTVKLHVAGQIANFPGSHEHARELAHEALADFDAVDPVTYPGRPLGQTATEYEGALIRARNDALVQYGRLLVSFGFEDEVVRALEAATAESPDPGLFEQLGQLQLRRGDAGRAARSFAVVASDLATPPRRAGGLAQRLGYSGDSLEWRRLQDSVTTALLARTAASALRRSLPPLQVADLEGNQLALGQVRAGKPAVIVFWNRSCGPCIGSIPEIVRLAGLLEPRGVRVVSIIGKETPDPGIEDWLMQHGVTYPVYYDLGGGAWDAFGVRAIPAEFVLDGDGELRFAATSLGEVPRQLEALGLLVR
ncbi:MAG: TlpA disulfide reductase family protein [Gemmatimonadota bacterium]|nr:TlpA disulfide reductase family protein [Gemmatimonadota bacterium]